MGDYSNWGSGLNAAAGAMASAANVYSSSVNSHVDEDLQREAWRNDTLAAQIAYERNSQEAVAARQWSEMMSNTSWRRGTEDMREAGINPMLAFSQGGASTPAAAVGMAPKANLALSLGRRVAPDVAGSFQKGISGAAEAQRVFQDVKTGKAGEENLYASKALQDIKKQTEAESARKEKELADQAKAQTRAIKAEAEYRARKAEFDRDWAGTEKALQLGGQGMKIGRDASGIVSDIVGGWVGKAIKPSLWPGQKNFGGLGQ